jgi:molecular chaperone DnaJ
MDYFKILEIETTNDLKIIKQAYKKLAKKYHPDICKSQKCEEKFKEINTAYQILSDEEKRKKFIQKNNKTIFDMGIDLNIDNIFKNNENTIYDKKYKRTKFYDFDIIKQIEVPLNIIYYGGEITENYEYYEECPKCQGFGGELEICNKCNGSSYITRFDNFVIKNETCDKCGGKGVKIINLCDKCGGKGYFIKKENIKIEIIKGLPEKSKLRYKNKGNKKDDKSGSLIYEINYKKSDKIYKIKNDLIVEVDLYKEDIEQILKNDFEKEIKYFDEKILLNSENFNSMNSNELLLLNKGFKKYNKNEKGNLILKFNFHFVKI